ncbi:SLC13 family permease [Entomomonas moraniae]|uniref:SLC13 family permease n=1 Tax=Entomomonas moraniae TaxID=2213226 RepID=A0A3Q9JJF2_9GAMM|nr:SLC13 family permease [Entomomonas moraniae]AZS50955.1 SLC13 family permease [Entomomonas moraniae]
MLLTIILSILIAIALGYFTKINIGIYAIVFAYIIGCYVLDLKSSQIIDFWPIKIFFIIFSVTLFYNVALANGALEKLAGHLLYKCKNFPQLLPLVVYFSATLIAALGAGFYTVLAFMAPITLLLCQRTNMSILIGGMAVNYGALAGANFMSSQSGIIFRGILENIGINNATAFTYSIYIFIVTFILPIILIGGYTFIYRNTNNIQIEDKQPEPFTVKQKTSLIMIILMMVIVLVFPILNLIFPSNANITFINNKIDISFIAVIFALISLILRLADEKKVIALVPWSTLIMICGMGMLIAVAVKTGVIDALSGWISGNVPIWMIPVIICIISAIMSIFCSTLGVVTPTLFPIVPAIASASGIEPALLFVCIVVGAQATAISPFTSGGSLILGSSPEGIDKDSLFNQLLFKAVPIGMVAAIIAIIVFSLVI